MLDPALKPSIAALIPETRERPYDGRMARYVMQQYANIEAAAAAGDGNE